MTAEVLAFSLDATFPLAQTINWWPAFLTPLWLLGVGVALGAAAVVIAYVLLTLLSFIPPLGHLADNRKAGVAVSLILGAIATAALCYLYVPRVGDGENAATLILPLAVLGVISGFAVVYGMWHRTRGDWVRLLGEGPMPYLLSTIGIVTAVGLLSTPLVVDRDDILDSIKRVNLFDDGVQVYERQFGGGGDTFEPADVDYLFRNLSEVRIESDRAIELADGPNTLAFSGAPTKVFPDEPLVYRYVDRDEPPIPVDPTQLHVRNNEADAAKVRFTFSSRPDIPQATSVVVIAIAFFVLIVAMMAFRQAAPRVYALALSTCKSEMAQPLYLLLLGLGIFIVLFFGFFPFNTLGDDIRVLKDSGVTLIMVMGMLQAVWSAGTSVSDEIEGRTALTVLSKPVSRRSFILGKYAGIMLAVLVLFVIISAVLLVVISYKPIYEARETTRGATTWQMGHDEIMSTMPVLGLYFMETAAIAAVAVALATRLPLLANFLTCFVVYVIGNLTSTIVLSGGQKIELVRFVGKLIAVVIPNLNNFNVQSAIDTGNSIPIVYLAAAFNYFICFAIMVWMLAMLLFEDRDLA